MQSKLMSCVCSKRGRHLYVCVCVCVYAHTYLWWGTVWRVMFRLILFWKIYLRWYICIYYSIYCISISFCDGSGCLSEWLLTSKKAIQLCNWYTRFIIMVDMAVMCLSHATEIAWQKWRPSFLSVLRQQSPQPPYPLSFFDLQALMFLTEHKHSFYKHLQKCTMPLKERDLTCWSVHLLTESFSSVLNVFHVL